MMITFYVAHEDVLDGANYPENTPLGKMKLVSVGVMIFMSLFTALFLGKDFSDGIIRNKLIAGYKRIEIFLGDLTASFVAMTGITAAWVIGGVSGGVDFFSSELALYTLKLLFFSASFQALLCLIATFFTNVSHSAGVSIVLMQTMLFLSFILGSTCVNLSGAAEGSSQAAVRDLLRVTINVTPFGQWSAATLFGAVSDSVQMSYAFNIISSAVMTAVFACLGILNLKKRDLK